MVVVNHFRRIDREYRRMLVRSLRGAALEIVVIPYRPESDSSGWMPSTVGNFVNFLRVASILVIPSCGLAEDKIALKILTAIVSSCSVKTWGSHQGPATEVGRVELGVAAGVGLGHRPPLLVAPGAHPGDRFCGAVGWWTLISTAPTR
jgi:hypothetical protein